MTLALLSDIPVSEALIRMAATAFVIIAVAWAVELFGPVIGGILAGLPITLGPGFYFLTAQASREFVAEAAVYALLSLCATQCFLLAYILCARKIPPVPTLAAGILTWALAAAGLHGMPPTLWLGALLFAITTACCLWGGRHAVRPVAPTTAKTSLGLLLLRGFLAGTLVAGVTTANQWLGAIVSGLLLAFPIGYSTISITLHQQLGRDTAIATLYSALLGGISLAAFCITLSLSLHAHAAYVALGLALAASALVTAVLAAWSQLRNGAATRGSTPGPCSTPRAPRL